MPSERALKAFLMSEEEFKTPADPALMRIRKEHLEKLAAAYLASTTVPPQQAVLVEQHDGNTWRWWFERKRVVSDE